MSASGRPSVWKLDVDDVYPRQGIWGFDLAPTGQALAFVLQRDKRAKVVEGSGNQGRRIATDLQADIVLLPAEGGYPEPITTSGEVTGAPRWSPDASKIAYLRAEQLIVMSPSGDTALTAFRGALYEPPLDAGDYWLGGLRWSPDSSALVVATHDEGRTALRLIGADGRDAREVFSIEGFILTWDWSPDGRRLAVVSRSVGGMTGHLHVVDAKTGDATVITDEGDYEYQKPAAAWLPDGRIVLRSNRSGWSKLWTLDDVRRVPEPLTTGEHDERSFRISPSGDSLVCESRRGQPDGGTALWSVPLGEGDPTLLTDHAGVNVPIGWSVDGAVVYWHSSPTEPGDLWRTAIGGKESGCQRLTRAAPANLARRLRQPEHLTVTGEDATTFTTLVYLPAQFNSGEAYPAIVWVHGGPAAEHRLEYEPLYNWLANEGFVVASPNYRGSTGFGVAHMTAVSGAGVGNHDLTDVLATARFLRSLPYVDATRGVGVGGHSWGGYLALMAAVRAPGDFSCVVASAAISDWHVQQGSTEVRYYDRWLLGGWVYDVAERARERSPISFVDRLTAPMLLYHGEEDRDVPFEQAQRFVDAARLARKEVQHRFFPHEGHSNKLPDNQRDFLDGTSTFFKRYLQHWNFVNNPCGDQIQYGK